MAVTVDNGSVTFYINGIASGGGSISPGAFPNTASHVQIGTAGSASYQFRGLIDEVAVYPSALSVGRILAHYDAGITNLAPTNISLTSTTVTRISLWVRWLAF